MLSGVTNIFVRTEHGIFHPMDTANSSNLTSSWYEGLSLSEFLQDTIGLMAKKKKKTISHGSRAEKAKIKVLAD